MPLMMPGPQATGKVVSEVGRLQGVAVAKIGKGTRLPLPPKQADGPPAGKALRAHWQLSCQSPVQGLAALSWEPTKCQDWGYMESPW